MLVSAVELGLLLGLRHAADADHVCTIASLLRAGQGRRQALLTAAKWGFGHSLSFFAVGLAPMSASVVELGFSPDSTFLAAADANGAVRAWTPTTERA